jgi:hypothetical protein
VKMPSSTIRSKESTAKPSGRLHQSRSAKECVSQERVCLGIPTTLSLLACERGQSIVSKGKS